MTTWNARDTNCWSAACFLLGAVFAAAGQDRSTWRDYGGASDSAQYSSLKQINRSNVNQLEVAWTYPTGDGRKYFFNPIVVDGVMYVLAKNNSIVALDAATGKEIWTYTPDPRDNHHHQPRHQLLGEQRPHRPAPAVRRNHLLQAIDARTGKPIPIVWRRAAASI